MNSSENSSELSLSSGQLHRRALLRLAAGGGLAMAALAGGLPRSAAALPAQAGTASPPALGGTKTNGQGWLNVREHGASGDGVTLASPRINAAIDEVARSGGGTVYFPAGVYRCYSLHLRSRVCLYLDQGATILAAETPLEGTTGGGLRCSRAAGCKL